MNKLNWQVTSGKNAGEYKVTSTNNAVATQIDQETNINYVIDVQAGRLEAHANGSRIYNYSDLYADHYGGGLEKFDKKFSKLLRHAQEKCELHYANRSPGKIKFEKITPKRRAPVLSTCG